MEDISLGLTKLAGRTARTLFFVRIHHKKNRASHVLTNVTGINAAPARQMPRLPVRPRAAA